MRAMRALLALLLLSCVVCMSSAHFSAHPLSKVHMHAMSAPSTPHAGTIRIDEPVLNGTGSWSTVSWTNMPSVFPGNQDWIGVWSPKPANYTTVTPAKYKFVTSDASGSGSTKLWFVNMRDSYVVVYFTGGLTTPTLLAESAPTEFNNPHIPMHIHLALTNDPTQMRVDWTTKQKSFPSVNYGLAADKLDLTQMRVLTTTYAASDMCGAPATTIGWHDPGFLHSTTLTGLKPNTQYYYQVGDESAGSRSEVLSFWSAPAPNARTTEFIIFGDLGQVEVDGSNEASQMDGSILTTLAMAQDIKEGRVHLSSSAAVFHIGDISYARGYATLWEQWWYQISSMTPYLPWMLIDGNHERDFPGSGSIFQGYDSGGECGVPLAKRFHMPSASPTTNATWWSLDFGPVHFTVFSTELNFDKNSEQWEWVAKDLANVDRSKTPFLVFTGHRPMYIDSTQHEGESGDQPVAERLRAAFEDLLVQYQVDVAFWGHHHSYQRTCPVYNLTCVEQAKGPIHIVTGAAGAGFSTNIHKDGNPSWIEYVEDNLHGYTRARVEGDADTLTIEFVEDVTREVVDKVVIQNKFKKA